LSVRRTLLTQGLYI